MSNVVLVLKTGGSYNFQDVELLCARLHMYWKSEQKINIYCLYDKVHEEVRLANCTLLPMTYSRWKGWWSKLNLFSPQIEYLRPFLYLDLDTAIVGDISSLFNRKEQEIIGLEDFYFKNKFASGVMWIPSNNLIVNRIWVEWNKCPEKYIQTYRGDQNFISNFICSNLYWQSLTDMICSFKARGKERGWLQEVPKQISIVCFHGRPKIQEAARTIKWLKEYVKE